MPRYRSAFSSFLLSILLAAFLAPGVALGASLMPPGKQAYTDSSGNPLAGGKVYTYAAGTSTPLATYSDQAGITPNANPVILDARGEATIFWSNSAGYKVTLRDSADALIWTQDNLYAAAGAGDTATFVGLRVADGTVGAPAYSWTNDTDTGFYLIGAADVGLSIAGTKRAEWTASGMFSDTYNPLTAATTLTLKSNFAAGDVATDVTINTATTRTAGNIFAAQNGGSNRLRLTFAGTLILGGTTGLISAIDGTNLGIELRGNKSAADAGADVVVNSTSTRTAGNLLDVQNNTTSKFRVDYAGTVTAPNVWKRAVATTDTSNSAVAAATDIAGLSFSCASGKRYLVRAVLFVYSAASTTGLGFAAKSTGGPTTSSQFFVVSHQLSSIAPYAYQWGLSAFNDAPVTVAAETLSTAAATPQVDRFEGQFVTTGTGTFQLRVRTEVDTSAVTVVAGSYLEWMEL